MSTSRPRAVEPVAVPSQSRRRPSPSGAVLSSTNVQVPRVRAGMVPRTRLVDMLTAATDAKLALIQAPVGSGKTSLLAEWHAAPNEHRPFAFLSLDRADNDHVRFLEGVIAALATVEPDLGRQALVDLAGPANLTDVVLPSLVNDLAAFPGQLILVLDDYHVIDSPRVHEAVTFLLDHQPDTVVIAVSSRAEPPLPLGRLRVRRELVEMRAAELRFTDEEAAALLHGAGVPALEPADITLLQDRTDGWAAGLQLAALSLSGRRNPREFISSFAGDDRPVVDYLGFEVLDSQPPVVRDFLLETSVLDRLSGSLCDAVVGRVDGDGSDSATLLDRLERAGLLLLPLDTKREWYRYHPLFAGLLRHELARSRPSLLPVLHRRASHWYAAAGHVSEAVQHAISAVDASAASALITAHWYAYLQRGRIETVAGWLDTLGNEAVSADPALCLTKAWIGVNTGRVDDVAFWIEAGRRAGVHGPVLESGVAGLREIHSYLRGDVELAVEAGRLSVARGETPWRPVGCPVLGIALFWAGSPDEASEELEASAAAAAAAGNVLAVVHSRAGLAAIRAEGGNLDAGDEVAQTALALAEENGLGEHWATTMARVVHGRALEAQGLIEASCAAIDRGVELSARGVATVEIAYARLAQAEARRRSGDPVGAAESVRHARGLVDRCPAPGILVDLLARTERRLHLASPVRAGDGPGTAPLLSEGELRVLRLLPSRLSQREIGRELYLSLNTVKSHARSIYRKLNVDTRDEAVARAKGLRLL